MKERTLYFYSNSGREVTQGELYSAILTISIVHFPHIEGCATRKNANLLTPENIGKKFKLSILDPYEIGEVTYLGVGLSAIPSDDDWILRQLKIDKRYIEGREVFMTPDDELVITNFLDVEPLF